MRPPAVGESSSLTGSDVRKWDGLEPVSSEEVLSATRTVTSARRQPMSQTASFWTLVFSEGSFLRRGDLRSRHRLPSRAVPTSRLVRVRRQSGKRKGNRAGVHRTSAASSIAPRRTRSTHPAPAQPSRLTLRSRSRRLRRRVRDHPHSRLSLRGWSRTTGAKQPGSERAGAGNKTRRKEINYPTI